MDLVGIPFVILLSGLILGWLARMLVPGTHDLSWSETIVVGIAGAGIGSVASTFFGADFGDGLGIRVAIGSVLGAMFVLAAYGPLRARMSPKTSGGVPTADLVAGGETERVEFKATARWNTHTQQRDSRVELVVAKTVAGMLNAGGGTLLIGVADDGTMVGLDPDRSLMKAPDDDRFQLWIIDHLERCLGKPAVTTVSVRFETQGGGDVCRVDVAPSDRPVFLDEPGGQRTADFYVRIGNSTRKLLTDEVLDYQGRRWGRQFRLLSR
jgi:uncharacterized membrane protein YeaQ/YmgE (transglycosylase-associated protein family)